MNDTQRRIARKLVELLVEAECTVSVWQEEDYTIKQSHYVDEILAAMGEGMMDTLEIDQPLKTDPDDPYQGNIYLVYHDKTTIIEDDIKPAIKPIVNQVKEFAASLAGEQP